MHASPGAGGRARDDALLDVIASWLALTDPRGQVDLLLLFGGSLPTAWDVAAELVRTGKVGALMLVGGRGHTTDVLERVVGSTGRTEADLMATYLRERHDVSEFVLERRSTNCGTNITFAKQVAAEHRLAPRVVGLIQERTMQRRMDAVFRKVWPEATPANFPGPDARDLWGRDRFISLVMGEVVRLRDDPSGYGPRGRGYIAHVDIPDEVEDAYAELLARHPHWGRPADPA